MKRLFKIIMPILAVCIAVFFAGCAGGEKLDEKNNTNFRILINNGSVFVYEFKDGDTGVWYIGNKGGIYPKINADGSLYKGNLSE